MGLLFVYIIRQLNLKHLNDVNSVLVEAGYCYLKSSIDLERDDTLRFYTKRGLAESALNLAGMG